MKSCHVFPAYVLDRRPRTRSAGFWRCHVRCRAQPSSSPSPSRQPPLPRHSRRAIAYFSPLYQQIKALITRSLQSGEWKPGEMIPSEMELASRYKVSQGTVRKAIDELAAENLVARRQGKGTARHHPPRRRGQVPLPAPGAGRGRTALWRQSRARVQAARARPPRSHGCSISALATASCRSAAC
ncbi:GntR family transcriptional regulator [Cupriavidus basilensis]